MCNELPASIPEEWRQAKPPTCGVDGKKVYKYVGGSLTEVSEQEIGGCKRFVTDPLWVLKDIDR